MQLGLVRIINEKYNRMNKVSEQRMKLRIEYSRETDLVFSDNIPAYSDWMEKKLALSQDAVIGSYAIVRWYDNNNEDVVCTTKEVAEDYVKKYNALSGKEKCFVDTEIWLPLKEA
jgi:hypothetical protein